MFQPTFQSLIEYQCPDWFRNVKFGIWSHWGPQSVPMYGDWYARQMYVQGSPSNLYHVRQYGHPSEFGWKDICALWKAENFHPEELMDLYYKAGARYFVAQAVHHDHFFNYDSQVSRFNSVNIGPGKDICMLWKKAAKKYNLPFGISEHLQSSFSWWKTNKYSDTYGPYKGVPYDGNDPAYRDFYHDNYEHVIGPAGERGILYTQNEEYHEHWLKAFNEIVDKFVPELIYSDGALPFGSPQQVGETKNLTVPGDPEYRVGLEGVAHYYNKSIEINGSNQAVYLQKDRRPEIFNIGILDMERSQLSDAAEKPWHTDTCIGNWFYDVRVTYKKPDQIIEMLIDTIAKNGTMLLSIPQKPDGAIDDETRYILNELAKWFAVCGEGVYYTRPWKSWREGSTISLNEEKTNWNSSDYRFVSKDDKVYAFILKTPQNRVAIIKSFINEKVKGVKLLGFGDVSFTQSFGIVTVKLPHEMPTEYTNCLEVQL